ncbi:hypothetical protein BKA65DRAFT_557658 [Rhexocercosporidium sp. MPI-PUGE-AT-0058]|nr:hypothetical protein BKA65DRAFT_557658 [Rhexocercosporidium sp. MPI-PUGE-AT-0058]
MRIRSNLGVMLRLQGKFQEAEFMLREVLSESIRLMGHDDVHVSLANFDLAEILHEAGKTEEALERYQLAITVLEFLDPKSPVLFCIFDGLGIVYRETGNLLRAESMSKLSYDENMALLK